MLHVTPICSPSPGHTHTMSSLKFIAASNFWPHTALNCCAHCAHPRALTPLHRYPLYHHHPPAYAGCADQSCGAWEGQGSPQAARRRSRGSSVLTAPPRCFCCCSFEKRTCSARIDVDTPSRHGGLYDGTDNGLCVMVSIQDEM